MLSIHIIDIAVIYMPTFWSLTSDNLNEIYNKTA